MWYHWPNTQVQPAVQRAFTEENVDGFYMATRGDGHWPSPRKSVAYALGTRDTEGIRRQPPHEE